jgi:hypothetical protein
LLVWQTAEGWHEIGRFAPGGELPTMFTGDPSLVLACGIGGCAARDANLPQPEWGRMLAFAGPALESYLRGRLAEGARQMVIGRPARVAGIWHLGEPHCGLQTPWPVVLNLARRPLAMQQPISHSPQALPGSEAGNPWDCPSRETAGSRSCRKALS